MFRASNLPRVRASQLDAARGVKVAVSSAGIKVTALIVLALSAGMCSTWAADTVTIHIPKRSKLSSVQRLNREGVEAVKKHDYERAEALFLKAYLFDPADPFTLNNLGYISELKGQLEHAQSFYRLASEQSCKANIDLSSAESLQGKPMLAAVDSLQGGPMRVNRENVQAMQLLNAERAGEAAALLRQALSLDPANPFTLNNLGIALEAIGDFESALKYYGAAVNLHSLEPVIITSAPAWSGKTVTEVAEANAKRVNKRLAGASSSTEQAALFNLRGVFAENQNDWETARQDFLRAYSLDPSNAFSLNNRGYVAEREGDLESAQFFYQKARRALDAGTRVGLATAQAAEGKPLFAVAGESDHKVDRALEVYSRERHRQTGPIELTPREGPTAGGSTAPPDQNAVPNSLSSPPPTTAPQSPR